MFQNLSFLGVTVTTFLLKPKFSDSVPSRNQGRLQPPERLCPNIFASLWHVGYVHCQVHLALPCCSHARCPFFLPVDNVVPSRFWASAFRPVPSGCSEAKVPRFQTGYVSFRFHSPGLYLVFSQDDKGILVSKQQNPWKKAGAALKGQVEERGWSVVRWITELQNRMVPLWSLGLKGELYHL